MAEFQCMHICKHYYGLNLHWHSIILNISGLQQFGTAMSLNMEQGWHPVAKQLHLSYLILEAFQNLTSLKLTNGNEMQSIVST